VSPVAAPDKKVIVLAGVLALTAVLFLVGVVHRPAEAGGGADGGGGRPRSTFVEGLEHALIRHEALPAADLSGPCLTSGMARVPTGASCAVSVAPAHSQRTVRTAQVSLTAGLAAQVIFTPARGPAQPAKEQLAAGEVKKLDVYKDGGRFDVTCLAATAGRCDVVIGRPTP
jgi:hypothetical protein